MGWLATVSALDGLVVAILLLAIARGLFRGLIGEVFSIAALGGACLAVRYGTSPAAAWLQEATRGEIGPGAAPWITGALLAIATIGVVAMVGRLLKRGAKAVGLGWADRLGGGALGAAEGALVAGLMLMGAIWMVGRAHPTLAGSRSLEAFDQLQAAVQERADSLPDVAAPPR